MVEYYWYLVFFIFFIIFIVIGNYRTKNLPPKQKELPKLFYSFVTFGGYVIFISFLFLFNSFTAYVPKDINNLEEMRNILNEQIEQIAYIKITLCFFLLSFLGDCLPAIYNFAKVTIPEEDKKILNLDNEENTPILGINI